MHVVRLSIILLVCLGCGKKDTAGEKPAPAPTQPETKGPPAPPAKPARDPAECAEGRVRAQSIAGARGTFAQGTKTATELVKLYLDPLTKAGGKPDPAVQAALEAQAVAAKAAEAAIPATKACEAALEDKIAADAAAKCKASDDAMTAMTGAFDKLIAATEGLKLKPKDAADLKDTTGSSTRAWKSIDVKGDVTKLLAAVDGCPVQ